MKSFITFLLIIFLTKSLFAEDKSNFEINDNTFLEGCEDLLANVSNMKSGYIIGYISGINDETLRRMDIYGMLNTKAVVVINVCQDYIILEGQEKYKNISKRNVFNYVIRKQLTFRNGYSVNILNKIDKNLKEKFAKDK